MREVGEILRRGSFGRGFGRESLATERGKGRAMDMLSREVNRTWITDYDNLRATTELLAERIFVRRDI